MNERELLLAALARNDAQARTQYLERVCAGDAALRDRIDALLKSHEETGGFLEEPGVHEPGATSNQTTPGDSNASAAEQGTGASPSHLGGRTQTESEATEAYTPGVVAHATGPTGDTDTGTPRTADFDATTEGPTRPLDLTHGTTVRYFADYEILKELGRGGMGVVYAARQISLNRPVAVKMIKAGILADIAELQRFQNEAEAVALLDHAGIVPVYEVGEHDGQRYFSMKLVDGGNLADQIDSFQTNFRAAATLVVETAGAVHHAHMRGILHRDLKPANILIDAEGHPHVTDFGLAKRVEGDIDLTASGAIMGTPAYMSPEQAFGRRHSITTATDVYGLGAILYALLTGTAPFGGDSAIETIDAVRNRPPDPPRMKNAQVPRDLETICLKCLEKDPRRRYASAHGLADDLKAWLDSRPITARRVGAAERAWLWSRRKPAVAALAAAVVVAVVGGTAGILAVQARANANLLVAYNKLDRANVALQSSNTLLEKQRIRAEDREQQAIDAVKKFRDAVAGNPELKDNPSFESLRKTLLKEPLAFFRSLRASLQADRDTRPESLARLAKAIHEYAHLTDEIGDTQDGLRSHEESLAIWEELTADHPQVPEYQYGLGLIHNCRGNMLVATGQLGAARKAHETALAIQQKLVDAHPSVSRYQSDLAAIHNNLGNLLGTIGQPDAARKAYEAALAIRQKLADANPSVTEYQWHLAISHSSLGFLLDHVGQPGAARKAYETALLIQQKLADEHPSVTEFQRSLATIHGSLANLLRASGQLDAARKAYTGAGAIFQKLTDLHPSVSRYQSDLAKYHYNLGTLLSATGHAEAARNAYEAALEIRRKLADAYPAVTEYQSDLGKSRYDLGVILRATGQPEAARKAYAAALPIWERLAREHPETPDYASRLGGLLHNIAVIDLDARRFDETRDRLQQAIVWQKRAVAIDPRNRQYRQFLTNHLNSMISTAEALGRHDLAAAAQLDLAKLEATDPRLESLDARLAAVLNGEATKTNAERLALARRAYDTQQYASAAKLWDEALKFEPKVADDRQAGHRYNAACAAALAGCGQGKDNPAPSEAAKATLREQARNFLQTELAIWTGLLDSRALQAQPTVVRTLKHWNVDTDLAGIRDAKALAALPEAERERWRGLWAGVDALLARAQAAPAAEGQK